MTGTTGARDGAVVAARGLAERARRARAGGPALRRASASRRRTRRAQRPSSRTASSSARARCWRPRKAPTRCASTSALCAPRSTRSPNRPGSFETSQGAAGHSRVPSVTVSRICSRVGDDSSSTSSQPRLPAPGREPPCAPRPRPSRPATGSADASPRPTSRFVRSSTSRTSSRTPSSDSGPPFASHQLVDELSLAVRIDEREPELLLHLP